MAPLLLALMAAGRAMVHVASKHSLLGLQAGRPNSDKNAAIGASAAVIDTQSVPAPTPSPPTLA